jgi:hypothetical protein
VTRVRTGETWTCGLLQLLTSEDCGITTREVVALAKLRAGEQIEIDGGSVLVRRVS